MEAAAVHLASPNPLRVEILSFDGCPNAHVARERVASALAAEALHAVVVDVDVDTPERALAWRFLGSPSIRVNGRDVEAGADDRTDFGIACRTYHDASGLSGAPSPDAVRAALRAAAKRSGGRR